VCEDTLMKLFNKLLVAPAALGLLVPMSAVAGEVNVNQISEYGLSQKELNKINFNSKSFSPKLATSNSDSNNLNTTISTFDAGSFSETTVASFSADFLLGATEGDETNLLDGEALTANYSFEIDLNTTFTGDDNLNVAIGSGNSDFTIPILRALDFGNANGDVLAVKDVNYTRSIGEKFTVQFGDSLDLSSQFVGACSYSGFTDILADCGTGNSAGAGGDVSLSTAYEIGNGFTFGAGFSGSEGSTTDGIFTSESNDLYGFQLAYAADNYGASVSYSESDTPTTDTTYWGLNAYYSFDNAFLDSISVGMEMADPSVGNDSDSFFVGLTTAEVGPGSISLALGTADDVPTKTALISDGADDTYLYEVSYNWNVNDATSLAVGGFIQERTTANGQDLQGIAFKTSFAF